MSASPSEPARPESRPLSRVVATKPARARVGPVRPQAAGPLVGRVEHGTGEARLGQEGQQAEIEALVGHEDGDETGAGRQGLQGREARLRVAAGEEADLHVVDAGAGRGLHRRHHAVGKKRQVADRGADRALAAESRHRLRHLVQRPGTERSRTGLLQVENVGTQRQGQRRLVQARHARQQLRHPAPSVLRHGS